MVDFRLYYTSSLKCLFLSASEQTVTGSCSQLKVLKTTEAKAHFHSHIFSKQLQILTPQPNAVLLQVAAGKNYIGPNVGVVLCNVECSGVKKGRKDKVCVAFASSC